MQGTQFDNEKGLLSIRHQNALDLLEKQTEAGNSQLTDFIKNYNGIKKIKGQDAADQYFKAEVSGKGSKSDLGLQKMLYEAYNDEMDRLSNQGMTAITPEMRKEAWAVAMGTVGGLFTGSFSGGDDAAVPVPPPGGPADPDPKPKRPGLGSYHRGKTKGVVGDPKETASGTEKKKQTKAYVPPSRTVLEWLEDVAPMDWKNKKISESIPEIEITPEKFDAAMKRPLLGGWGQ
jgi:hypothetical protein